MSDDRSINPRHLPEDRLSTTDARGRRLFVYTADVRGFFKARRTLVQGILILLFLLLPWVHINGHQAILLDLAHRKFAFFGITFWAHDAPLIVFLLLSFTLGIGFVTAVWGRAWCGWACPQTVFIDGVFRKIERCIEGDGVRRKQLDSSEWNLQKLFKKSAKWLLFTATAMIIAHSFLAYFVGTERLFVMIRTTPSDNIEPFLVMAFTTAVLLLDFGWFREQFCIIMCPYGRFQSVIMDERSTAVLYDNARPDCVNCFRCVQVCPTGIDIRRGLQMECIACTACIDACDEVMVRTKQPLGLIRYSCEAEIKTPIIERAAQNFGTKFRLFRTRPSIYFILFAIVLSGLIFTLSNRKDLSYDFLRAHDAPYSVVDANATDPTIINHYKFQLENQSFNPVTVEFDRNDETQKRNIEFVTPVKSLTLAGGTTQVGELFIKFPKSLLKFGHANTVVLIKTEKMTYTQEVHLVGPSY